MPFKDRTGPLGQGPLTGRGFGQCGKGLGFGRGIKGGFSSLTKEQAKDELKEYKKDLEEELKLVKDKLTELEAE